MSSMLFPNFNFHISIIQKSINRLWKVTCLQKILNEFNLKIIQASATTKPSLTLVSTAKKNEKTFYQVKILFLILVSLSSVIQLYLSIYIYIFKSVLFW